MFFIWWSLNVNNQSEEDRAKECEDSFKNWAHWYKSLTVKEKKWEDRKNAIIVYGIGAFLILSVTGSIIAGIILIYNNLN